MIKLLKKIFWSILTIIIAGILFCLLIFLFNKNKDKSDTQINIYTITTWNIEKTIEVYGNAELKKEDTLWFTIPWDVAEIYINEWDYVTKWQILASLDTENLDNDIRQAELSLDNAKINYQDLYNWGTDTQIIQAENSLEQSKSALKLAEQQLDELENNSNIDTVWNNNDTAIKSTALSIKDYITQWEKAVIALDKIFGVSSQYESENDAYENYISSKNKSYKRKTENMILQSYHLLDTLKNDYNHLDNSLDIDDKNRITNTLKSAEDFFEQLYDTCETAYQALENSETNETLTPAMIWTFESTISSYSTLAKSSLANIVSSTNTIKNLNSSNTNDLSIQAKKNEIENLRNTIRLQEQSLQDIRNWGTDSQKNIAANGVEQWEITVNKAKKWLESYQITAPFDWKIRKIDFELWDKISTTNPKYIYIENPDLIEISVLLDQIDIVQVAKWMPAEVEFDAYPWIIFYGSISDIDTKANISAWVVSYTVKINIEKWEYKIYGWMSANVKIILDRQTDIIKIPTTYIQHIWEKNYVTNKSGDLIEIELGISNWNMTEIIKGLNNWDQIVKEVSKETSGLFGWMSLEEVDQMHDETMMQNMNL